MGGARWLTAKIVYDVPDNNYLATGARQHSAGADLFAFGYRGLILVAGSLFLKLVAYMFSE